ncbi:amino acid/polyamine transporter I [Mycena albidolilacea]|uniref:Amino acid/polyamine transporter I n=1 Tax=Mycena albidolilacea TaxID=1033008 RepID=A0AAD7EVB4_9AGAR|nr:amino acid/polyamine transporter I [Mycena albidolilacea]
MATTQSHNSDDARLAELGYKQEFKRHFTLWETFGISFSMVSVVPSIASVFFIVLSNGGPVSMIWGWLTAGFFTTLVCIAVSELASAAPTAGGLYYWTHRYASPQCRKLLSWIVGYSNTIYLMAGVASVAWSITLQIAACVTVASNFSWAPTTAQLFGISTAVLVAQALVACFSTRIMARLQSLVIAVNFALILVVIISLPAATPKEFKNDTRYALGEFENINGWPDGFAFCLSFLAPLWSIGAFDVTVHISEEASNANFAVPWANMMSTSLAVITGVAVNIAVVFCMGDDLLSILSDPTGQPFATASCCPASISFTTPYMKILYRCCIITLAASRQTFAFARDGALPFSFWIYRINKFSGTPVNAVWVVTGVAFILTLLVFAGPTATTTIFSLTIVAQYLSYIIPIFCRLAFKNDFTPGPFYTGRLSAPISIISLVWMVFMMIVFMCPATPMLSSVSMNYTSACLGAWVLLALVGYYFPFNGLGGVYWFKGPVPNIDTEREFTSSAESMEKSGDSDNLEKKA